MSNVGVAGSVAAQHAQNVLLLDKAHNQQKLEGEAALRLIAAADNVGRGAVSAPVEPGKGRHVDAHA